MVLRVVNPKSATPFINGTLIVKYYKLYYDNFDYNRILPLGINVYIKIFTLLLYKNKKYFIYTNAALHKILIIFFKKMDKNYVMIFGKT